MNSDDYGRELSLDERVLLGLVRVAEFLKREEGTILKKCDLTFSQYNFLRALGAKDDGKNRLGNLAEVMLVASANLTGLSKRLEKMGFIRRGGHPDDERVKMVEIKPKGRRALDELEPEREKKLVEIFKQISNEEKKIMLMNIKTILKKNAM